MSRRWLLLAAFLAADVDAAPLKPSGRVDAKPAAKAMPVLPPPAAAAAAAKAAAPVTSDPAASPAAQAGEARRLAEASGRVFDGEVWERGKTLALRAATVPAYAWPFSRLARALAHGEPLLALTPKGAAKEAAASADPMVVGRLAWELRDRWSVRGAERSYMKLIEALGREKEKRPGFDAAVSLDAESLGLHRRGLSAEQRLAAAGEAALRLASTALARGLDVELDMGATDAFPSIVAIARRLAESGVPVRLALAARHAASEAALSAWADLAAATGLRLGVRLVKGSFVEAKPGAINEPAALREIYLRLITRALESGRLDVAVASHDPAVWEHASAESARLGAAFAMHFIRGINPGLQDRVREAGRLGRVYGSYGLDAPGMGLLERWANWKQRRRLRAGLGA